jgi:hypothetical protein
MEKLFGRFRTSGRSTAVLAAALGLVATGVHAAAPAAATPSALARCNAGAAADVDVTLTHWGNADAVSYPFDANSNPPDVIRKGDVIRVEDGSGDIAPSDAGFPFVGEHKFASITRPHSARGGVWVGRWFPTSTMNRCFEWSHDLPVRLIFHQNDSWTPDNGGAWRYRVRHYHG